MSTGTSTKTSACIDCQTPIIGDQDRCPACHDQRAAKVNRRESLGHVLLSWVVLTELLAMILCGLLLVSRGCA